MYQVVLAKFNQNHHLKEQLLNTGSSILIEGNWWHDNFWGDCECINCSTLEGRNELGKIIMKIRNLVLKEVKRDGKFL